MICTTFNTIGIIGKPNDYRVADALQAVIHTLGKQDYQLVIDDSLSAYTKEQTSRREKLQHCDVVIVLGGDGTLLAAARSLADYDVPIIGVNLGRLGFLVDVDSSDKCETIENILAGEFNAEERIMLETEVWRDTRLIYHHNAMNDVVLHFRKTVRMIEFETFINNRFVNLQRADGLVISTPSGSTAYALSNGGPILHPTLQAIAMMPICPHTLSSRPIVVDADDEIEVRLVNDNNEAQVVCDGQSEQIILAGDLIKVRKASKNITLLHPKKYDYYHILREKLDWR